MEWNEFCEKIFHILGFCKRHLSLEYDENQIMYTIASQKYVYTKEDYDKLLEEVKQFGFKRYSMCDGYTYESLVHLPDISVRRTFSMHFEDKLADLTVRDEDVHVTYSFKEVSSKLIWYIIKDYDVEKRVYMRFSYFMFDQKCASLPSKDLFSILKLAIRFPLVICVTSDHMKSRDLLQKYAQSFLFNIAYNFDFVFKPVIEFEDLFPQRIPLTRRRIHDATELMAPQLSYKEELVEQYYMALLSQDPFVEFIGFYHIMEHFYEEVYNEDMVGSVRNIIQHPGFSSKRTKDIVKIVEFIKKKNRQSKEEFQGSELEALELTLKKFVNITDLICDLNAFDDSLLGYYKTSEVRFSKGDTVDLKDGSHERIYQKLAVRIYKTRNSLVHSKSNENRLHERGVYNVFDNRQELLKEIPLMRYISEAIIIHSATSL